ncbi:MAG: ribonuclease D, partial [Pirellulales bacterium]
MTHLTITTPSQLDDFCRQLTSSSRIGFDTEFVSEDTYRPQLCLVQVATDDTLAVIDPLEIDSLRPFWNLLANQTRETIVHAGREEVGFCLTAIERSPQLLFDTQIAAALVGTDYPAGYAALVTRFLGKRPNKGETRTDWRRRPLSAAQIDYALEDVRYLLPLRDRLHEDLQSRGRVEWMRTETDVWHDELVAARSRQRWRRVSGISGLSPRSMAIVRELWTWRDEEAQRRNAPPRRVLRDDLIVEIAKRRSADTRKIRSIRGLNHRPLERLLPQLAACVQRGL